MAQYVGKKWQSLHMQLCSNARITNWEAHHATGLAELGSITGLSFHTQLLFNGLTSRLYWPHTCPTSCQPLLDVQVLFLAGDQGRGRDIFFLSQRHCPPSTKLALVCQATHWFLDILQ